MEINFLTELLLSISLAFIMFMTAGIIIAWANLKLEELKPAESKIQA